MGKRYVSDARQFSSEQFDNGMIDRFASLTPPAPTGGEMHAECLPHTTDLLLLFPPWVREIEAMNVALCEGQRSWKHIAIISSRTLPVLAGCFSRSK
jgi:hypothetical protein